MKKSILFVALVLCLSACNTQNALLNEFINYCEDNEALKPYKGEQKDLKAVCRWYIEQPSFDDVTDFDKYVQVYNAVYE